MKLKNKDEDRTKINGFARYSGLAFEMLGIIALGTWGGYNLDAWFNTKPLLTAILSLLSVFFALYIVLKDFIGHAKDRK
jgi:F0F1-type ATP synthase assembly protein I